MLRALTPPGFKFERINKSAIGRADCGSDFGETWETLATGIGRLDLRVLGAPAYVRAPAVGALADGGHLQLPPPAPAAAAFLHAAPLLRAYSDPTAAWRPTGC